LRVPSGREFGLRFCGVPVDGDYTWVWECHYHDERGKRVALPRQSTLSTLLRTPAQLRSMSEHHRPALGLEGRRWLAVLPLIESGLSMGEIAAALSEGPARCFSTAREALDWLPRVAEMLDSGGSVRL
jgi:hypothetical protein